VLRKLVPSRGYVGLALLTVLLAAMFVRLGFWQLHRLHERRDFKAAVVSAERAPIRPLEQVATASSDPEDVSYRRVEVEGRYRTADEVVVYGRALHEEPGNHVLTPLLTSSGRAILVDRGWVPVSMDHPPVPRATPPLGKVRVTGLLLPPEASSSGSGRVRVVTRIDPHRIGAGLRYPVYPVYIQLQSQRPAQPGALPVRLPPPDLNGGPPNLSYAIQWFSFAGIALVGYVVLARRKDRAGPEPRDPPAAQQAERTTAPKAAR
jgi:cytochrome oxidase assembly protein ShyY1